DVEVFDTTFSTRDLLFRRLTSEKPSVLGVYANLMTRKNVIDILHVAREAGWQTVVGGPEPGAYALEHLQSGADFVVVGEGEVTMEELLHAMLQGETDSYAKVPGIAFLDERASLHQTAPRKQIDDLDAQPWPARDAIDIPRYVRTWRTAHGQG